MRRSTWCSAANRWTLVALVVPQITGALDLAGQHAKLVDGEPVAHDVLDAEVTGYRFGLHGQRGRAQHHGVATALVGVDQIAHLRVDQVRDRLPEDPLAHFLDVLGQTSLGRTYRALDHALELVAPEPVLRESCIIRRNSDAPTSRRRSRSLVTAATVNPATSVPSRSKNAPTCGPSGLASTSATEPGSRSGRVPPVRRGRHEVRRRAAGAPRPGAGGALRRRA